ncbi:hypothetical protein BKA70DRAFT_1453574 [Coprinopsis sp. MPI-PUGE-AT-0042]|nr:hypothetical protein BKA70DRAFT_1453574 [Coprinopsis sp. MPI-PUGE-AT-0042]
MPSNPPTPTPDLAAASRPGSPNLDSATDSAQAAEGIKIEPQDSFVQLETSWEDLDNDATHQPRAFNRSPLAGDLDSIYIKEIYPRGYGDPCPNPCPQGPPVRIGDVGELTSNGFIAIANLFDCQIPALRSQLASLGPPDVLHEPHYLSEGQSITSGVSVEIRYFPGTKTIQDMRYRCHAPQGAILALTSPAQLHTLTGSENRRLWLWLCDHEMEFLQHVDPGRTDPLYVVTGKVTSSSWAIATYTEAMPESDNDLVLTHTPGKMPPYYWSKPGTAQTRSKSSSAVNKQGQRASDQCLFLQGYLIPLNSKDASGEPR